MSSWLDKIQALDLNQSVNWSGGAKRVSGQPTSEVGTVGQPNYQNYELSPKFLLTAQSGTMFTHGRGHADFAFNSLG